MKLNFWRKKIKIAWDILKATLYLVERGVTRGMELLQERWQICCLKRQQLLCKYILIIILFLDYIFIIFITIIDFFVSVLVSSPTLLHSSMPPRSFLRLSTSTLFPSYTGGHSTPKSILKNQNP